MCTNSVILGSRFRVIRSVHNYIHDSDGDSGSTGNVPQTIPIFEPLDKYVSQRMRDNFKG